MLLVLEPHRSHLPPYPGYETSRQSLQPLPSFKVTSQLHLPRLQTPPHLAIYFHFGGCPPAGQFWTQSYGQSFWLTRTQNSNLEPGVLRDHLGRLTPTLPMRLKPQTFSNSPNGCDSQENSRVTFVNNSQQYHHCYYCFPWQPYHRMNSC